MAWSLREWSVSTHYLEPSHFCLQDPGTVAQHAQPFRKDYDSVNGKCFEGTKLAKVTLCGSDEEGWTIRGEVGVEGGVPEVVKAHISLGGDVSGKSARNDCVEFENTCRVLPSIGLKDDRLRKLKHELGEALKRAIDKYKELETVRKQIEKHNRDVEASRSQAVRDPSPRSDAPIGQCYRPDLQRQLDDFSRLGIPVGPPGSFSGRYYVIDGPGYPDMGGGGGGSRIGGGTDSAVQAVAYCESRRDN